MSKQQSLAAKENALERPLNLPAAFAPATEAMKERHLAPYISFAHPNKKDEWTKITSKCGSGVEGGMYLIADGKIVPLPKAKLGWLTGRQFWAQINPAGEPLVVSYTEMPDPFRECIEAVCLLYIDDRVFPVNMGFRTTKCPAAKSMSEAFIECQQPTWPDKGPAYRETLICAQPFMRFYADVELGASRTSKSTGLPYRTTVATIFPTGVTEWRALKKLQEDPETSKVLEEAAARFTSRMQEMDKKVLK